MFTTNPIPCSAPTVTSESGIMPTSAEVQWIASAPNYEVRYHIVGTSLWQTISGITTSNWTITGLTENTNYEWQIRSQCSEEIYSSWKSGNFTTPLSPTCGIISNLTTDDITQTSASFNWAASTDPTTYYTVQYRIVGNYYWEFWNRITIGTSWAQTELVGGTNYEWRVKATCQNGQTSDWVTASFSTMPFPSCVSPSSLNTSEVTSSNATLHWTSRTNANSYNIRYKKTIDASWQQSNILTDTFILIASLTANTDYEWQVQTNCIDRQTSDWSHSNFTTAPLPICSTPTNPTTNSISTTNAIINWRAVYNVSSYQVRYRKQGTTSWQSLEEITTNFYALNGLNDNTTYEWQVSAKCINGYNSDYLQATFRTSPITCSAPTLTLESGETPTTAQLQWVDVASTYEIRYSVVGSTDWQTISGITVPTWTLTGLTENSNYKWEVRSQCAEGIYSSWKSDNFTTPPYRTCATPSNLITDNITQTSARFNWIASTDPTTYYAVQFRTAGNDYWESWNRVTSGTSWAQTGLIGGTNYEWQVQTRCQNGQTSDWVITSFTTAPLTPCIPPSDLNTSDITTTKATIHWAGMTNATNYNMRYKKITDTNWQQWNLLRDSFRILSSLTPDTNYEWQIQTNCLDGQISDWIGSSFMTSSIPVCAKATNLTVSNILGNSVTLSWNGINDGATYDIAYRTIPGGWGFINDVGSTSYNLNNLSTTKGYNWYIRTTCSNGVISISDISGFAINSSTACPNPNVLTTNDVSNTEATLTWNSMSNAISYSIGYQIIGEENWVNIYDITSTNYKVTGLSPNTSYRWSMVAICNNGLFFSWADPINFTTTPSSCEVPSASIEGNITPTTANLQWAAVNEALNYELRYRIVGIAQWQTVSEIVPAIWALTGLTEDANYEWQIRSQCSAGFYSSWKSDSFTTPKSPTCAAPSSLTTNNITQTSASFNWVGSPDPATYYTIQHRIVGNNYWEPANEVMTGTSWTQTGLVSDTNYEWRIQTLCQNGQISDWIVANFMTASDTQLSTVMDFDGVNDYLDIQDGLIDEVTDFTIETWFYYDESPSSHYSIFDLGRDWNARINMQIHPNYFTFKISNWDWDNSRQVGSVIWSNSMPSPGNWYHVAVSYQSDIRTAKLYPNGEEVGVENEVKVEPRDLFARDKLYIGRSHNYQNNTYFKGKNG